MPPHDTALTNLTCTRSRDSRQASVSRTSAPPAMRQSSRVIQDGVPVLRPRPQRRPRERPHRPPVAARGQHRVERHGTELQEPHGREHDRAGGNVSKYQIDDSRASSQHCLALSPFTPLRSPLVLAGPAAGPTDAARRALSQWPRPKGHRCARAAAPSPARGCRWRHTGSRSRAERTPSATTAPRARRRTTPARRAAAQQPSRISGVCPSLHLGSVTSRYVTRRSKGHSSRRYPPTIRAAEQDPDSCCRLLLPRRDSLAP